MDQLQPIDYEVYGVTVSLDGMEDENFDFIQDSIDIEKFEEIMAKVIYFFSKEEKLYLDSIYVFRIDQTDDDGYIYRIEAEIQTQDDDIKDLVISNIDLDRFGGKIKITEKVQIKVKTPKTLQDFYEAVNYYM